MTFGIFNIHLVTLSHLCFCCTDTCNQWNHYVFTRVFTFLAFPKKILFRSSCRPMLQTINCPKFLFRFFNLCFILLQPTILAVHTRQFFKQFEKRSFFYCLSPMLICYQIISRLKRLSLIEATLDTTFIFFFFRRGFFEVFFKSILWVPTGGRKGPNQKGPAKRDRP